MTESKTPKTDALILRQRNEWNAQPWAHQEPVTFALEQATEIAGHAVTLELELTAAQEALAQEQERGRRLKDGFTVLLAASLKGFFEPSTPTFNRVIDYLKAYPIREDVTVESAIDGALRDAIKEG